MSIADLVNEYIAAKEPWKLAKNDETKTEAIAVCSDGINMFRLLIIYLRPILPEMADKCVEFLKDDLDWHAEPQPLYNHSIAKFEPLMGRIDTKLVDKMMEANSAVVSASMPKESKASNSADKKSSPADSNADVDTSNTIEFADFAKVDMRVAKILEAKHVDGADKLLQLTLDIGDRSINVFSGIKSCYQPEDIAGRLTVAVVNLQPRKMKFGLSEGMVLCAGEGKELWLLEVDSAAKPGMPVA